MTDPSHSKRGRPRGAVPGVAVGTWLRTTEYDRLLRTAQRRETTVSALLRRLVQRRLRRR
jgi:hypothetical protein